MGRNKWVETVRDQASCGEARGVYCLVVLAPGRAMNAAGATKNAMKTKAIKMSDMQSLRTQPFVLIPRAAPDINNGADSDEMK